jgi:hypothetical protein
MLLLLKKTQASKASDTLPLPSPLGFSQPDLLPLIYALTLTRLGPSHRTTPIS